MEKVVQGYVLKIRSADYADPPATARHERAGLRRLSDELAAKRRKRRKNKLAADERR